MNFFENLLKLNQEDCFIIPDHWGGPIHFYSFSFEGWKFSLDYTDPTMNEVMYLCGCNMNNFIQLYKDAHAFTQPQLAIKMDGTVLVKIATMELEIYHQMMEKNKSNT